MAELSIAIADDNRQTLNLLGEILEKEDGIHVVRILAIIRLSYYMDPVLFFQNFAK